MTREQEARLREIEVRRAEIRAEMENRGADLTEEQLDTLNTEVTALNEERTKLVALQDRRDALRRSVAEGAAGTVVQAFGTQQGNQRSEEIDHSDTPEYRRAFMDFVCRNTPIPSDLHTRAVISQLPPEVRASAVTTVEGAGAVIPMTTLQEIIRKMESYGAIYAKVRKLNIQGGVRVPILSLKPTATWVGEGASEDQKIQANTFVEFSYSGLECKIAQTLLANVVTYEMFQREFVKLATEAIIVAMEKAIFLGTGAGQALGILKDTRVPAANTITLPAADFVTWAGWQKKVVAKMKKAYRNGIYVMAQGTFDGYINGMTDETGQPIGRVTYGITESETYRFGGKSVETVEDDIIMGYDEAAVGDVVAAFFNPSDYAINSNMQMNVVKWVDHDDNKVKNKAILICDGKLLNPNGVLIIKKGA